MGSSITAAASQPEWTLLDSQTPAAAATVTSAALPAYDLYKVECLIVGMTGINVNLNANAGAQYSQYTAISTLSAGNTTFTALVCSSADKRFLQIYVEGLSGDAPGNIGMFTTVGPNGSTILTKEGLWVAGAAVQVTEIKLTAAAGTITGVVKFYGKMV